MKIKNLSESFPSDVPTAVQEFKMKVAKNAEPKNVGIRKIADTQYEIFNKLGDPLGVIDVDTGAETVYESLNEGENREWTRVESKSVRDSDGFWTEYTMYKNNAGEYIFMFGDSEIYDPDPMYADFETDSEKEAREWMDSYEGFEEEEEDEEEYNFVYEELKGDPDLFKAQELELAGRKRSARLAREGKTDTVHFGSIPLKSKDFMMDADCSYVGTDDEYDVDIYVMNSESPEYEFFAIRA